MKHYDLNLKINDLIQLKRNMSVQDYWDGDNLFPVYRFRKGSQGVVTDVSTQNETKYYTIKIDDKDIGIKADVSSKFLVK